MPRTNSHWTSEEDARLSKLIAEGKAIAAIAKELQRTEVAISARINSLRTSDRTRDRRYKQATISSIGRRFPQRERAFLQGANGAG